MKISVDISLYPLNADYLPPIDAFIKSLYKYSGLQIKTHHLSTMIIGDYTEVMDALNKEIFASLSEQQQASFVLKILKGDAAEDVYIEQYR